MQRNLKQEREKVWQYCEEYKNRIKYPLHPDAEIRIKNSWLTNKTIENILNKKNNDKDIEKTLNNHFILYRKNTIGSNDKAIILFTIPIHDGDYKIMVKA